MSSAINRAIRMDNRNTVSLKLDPKEGANNQFAPVIEVYTTYNPVDKFTSEAAEILREAERAILALLEEIRSGALPDLPAHLFEQYGDLMWVKNIPNIASQGMLSPAFLSRKMADSPVRSPNDARLVILATEYAAQMAVEKFGTSVIHSFGTIQTAAEKMQADVANLYKKVNDECCTKVLKMPFLNLGMDNSGLSLADDPNPGKKQDTDRTFRPVR